jgi:hypothetical protein
LDTFYISSISIQAHMNLSDWRRRLIAFFFGLGVLFVITDIIHTAMNNAVSDWLSSDLLVAGVVFIIIAVGIGYFTTR